MHLDETAPYWQPFVKAEQVSQWVVGLDHQLKQATDYQDVPWSLEQGQLQTCSTPNSFWLIYEVESAGKLAIRTCFDPQTIRSVKLNKKTSTTLDFQVEGALGLFRVKLELASQQPVVLRYTTSLTPNQDFSLEALPRDVYVLDKDYDPSTTEGMVYVTQNGPTAGLAFWSVTKPVEGTIFYFQNLTALNPYCQLTHTDPSGSVNAQWPEVGFSLPASEQPLSAGTEVVLSDAFIYLSKTIPTSEFEAADQFLEAIDSIYRHLPKPATDYFDWPKLANQTIKALSESPDCSRHIKNHFYVNAYVSATQKPPESMVQLAILVPLTEYQDWLGRAIPLVDQLQKSIPTFYDETRATLMRWLPGEPFRKEETSEEEDHNKIDSWYLLHTLMNLGRLAQNGNVEAKDLLFRSIDFAIGAAHHFNYNWPVFYDSLSLEVLKAETAEGRGGELDVAGLYTHVMLQVYELTREPRYLAEAKKSAERLRGKGFELLYQSNITLMSALTLAKLWKLTGNRLYFDLSKLGVANVIARLWIWDCNFGFGQHRSTFLGVAPLRDAEYVAAYEEAEIFATIHNYLIELNDDVPPSVRLLFSEYMKYLLHRGRYYFPSQLPLEMVSQQPREGRILTDLPIPLEDISTGWKQAGTVGQEVYGGALAYILTTYSYKNFDDVPVIFYAEYPICQADYQLVTKDSGYAVYRLGGTAENKCRIRLLAKGRQLPQLQMRDEDNQTGDPLSPIHQDKNYQEYEVPGNLRLRVDWTKPA
ncbi:hypothetical protein [Spirosoma oryzicola]|uniref:hypothetical protein n=1 Tax=Spirosoma oryzicola TaxID=2898794 RepID=UPI001E4A63E9|nr:hypothetical protein [Spirosoma oryzicola]UHG94240.1 hypothetical protein LQ777_27095 [Spirosoma oryzicola]